MLPEWGCSARIKRFLSLLKDSFVSETIWEARLISSKLMTTFPKFSSYKRGDCIVCHKRRITCVKLLKDFLILEMNNIFRCCYGSSFECDQNGVIKDLKCICRELPIYSLSTLKTAGNL